MKKPRPLSGRYVRISSWYLILPREIQKCDDCDAWATVENVVVHLDKYGMIRNNTYRCLPCAEKHPNLWRQFVIDDTKRRMTT